MIDFYVKQALFHDVGVPKRKVAITIFNQNRDSPLIEEGPEFPGKQGSPRKRESVAIA
jgi:hypothetical protein